MSMISLKSLISFFVVLLFKKRCPHCFNISVYYLFQMLPSNLFVTPTQAISIFLLILYVKVVWKQPWRDFLLSRLNLLIFNIIFTSNVCRVLGSSSLWGVHLSKAAGFRSAVLLGMSSYAAAFRHLL